MASLDILERNLDRLERFFLLRKKRTPSTRNSTTVPTTVSTTEESRPVTLPTPLRPEHASEPSADSMLQTFPQPSFIRPKSSRMLARDDANLTIDNNRRARSLPGPHPNHPERASAASSADISSSYSKLLDQFPHIPQRTSSLRTASLRASSLTSSSLLQQRLVDVSLAELLDFSFSDKLRKSADSSVRSISVRSRGSRSRSGSGSVSPRSRTRQQERPALLLEGTDKMGTRRPDTPPLSARDDKFPPSTPPRLNKMLPPVPANGNPTPEPSPKLLPVHPVPDESPLPIDEPSPKTATRPQRSRSFQDHVRKLKSAVASLRKVRSDSTLSQAFHRMTSKAHAVLTEPSLTEFMSLSDDDIADGRPLTPVEEREPEPVSPSCAPPPPEIPTSALAPSASPTSPAPHKSRGPLLTLSPPMATRPATAAAFEAARIAQRYGFDLVYVVNLWPNHIGCSPHHSLTKQPSLASLGSPLFPISPTISERSVSILESVPEPHAQATCVNPRSGMTGRLLAAYGLPGVVSPFRISAPVHLKVLRTDGWLEYRRERAAPDEFSRGYGCAFHAAYSPEGSWRPMSPQKVAEGEGEGAALDEAGKRRKSATSNANRGIVFAAYRLPRADGTTRASSEAELEALRMDAETLVEMLIDIHVAQRQRRLHPRAKIFADGTEAKPISTAPLVGA